MNLQKALQEKIAEGLKEGASKLIIPDPVDWIEHEFHIPETKNDPKLRGRIQLMKYQEDVIREVFSKDKDGNFKYSIIVWSDIKKSAKSTISAAVNIYRAHHMEFGEFYIVANDLKQAYSRVFHYAKRAVQLNPKLNSKYSIAGYRITTQTGSYIEAIPIDPSGEAGGNADGITWCMDAETEVLTRDGWKTYDQLHPEDEYATRSPEGYFEWQKSKKLYCSHYSGEMYRVNNRSIDMLVTPDHRIYGRFVGGRGIAPGHTGSQSSKFVATLENRFLKASVASKTSGYYPVTKSEWKDGVAKNFVVPATYWQYGKGKGVIHKLNQPELTISPELYAEFMGWYLSEGCVVQKKGVVYGFAIGQSSTHNPKARKRIIEILKEMGFVPHEWAGGMNIVVYHTEFAKILKQYGLSGDKYIPEDIKNLPKNCLEIFLSAYLEGDGCQHDNYGYTAGSKSKTLRDDVVEVAQKCGYSVSSYETVDKRWRYNPVMYCVYIRSNSEKKTTKVEKKSWKIENYNGIVFCPSTENGVIYVRRNGTYYWTGNSELWGSNERAKQDMWTEQTIPPAKYGKAFRWIESYAGFSEESDLLYSLYDLGVKQGHLLWPDRLYDVTEGEPTPLELYVNETAGMLLLWNTQPRCPWQTKKYYAAEEQILPPNQFQRIHRNQWVTSSETFVPMAWVYACHRTNEEWPKIDFKHHPMIIAMDAATSNDNFAIWMGCRHPEQPTEIMTIYAKKWAPNKHTGKIDFQGTEDKPGPEMVLRDLIKNYNVIQVAYDPYQLHDMSMRLKQEGLAWFRSFNQGTDRLVADSQLRDLIRDRRFWHRSEPDLIEHLQNANAKLDDQDSKIRIVKRADRLKIDLAVATSMGSHELLRLNLT